MKKVCVVTAARSEYGLLKWIMSELMKADDIKLQVLVTGAHLSPEHGMTVNEIIDDGFEVDREVEMLLSTQTDVGLAKSMGLCSMGIADALAELKPDLVVVLGDRYELLPICSVALVMGLMICHISGGDITEGAIDDQVRNAITMMSSLHFPGTEESASRIRRMRGSKCNVFVSGEPGLDNFIRYELMTRKELAENLHLDINANWYLLTLHPETKQSVEANIKMAKNVIDALMQQDNVQCVITQANADLGGSQINAYFTEICAEHPTKFSIYPSLGQRRYLSFMKQVACVVGNSSSGIVEAPFLGKAAVNIGNRQKGRHVCTNVRSVVNDADFIACALKEVAGKDVAPDYYYGDGHSAERISKKIIEFVCK